jgi:hypothetical protein
MEGMRKAMKIHGMGYLYIPVGVSSHMMPKGGVGRAHTTVPCSKPTFVCGVRIHPVCLSVWKTLPG